MCIRDSKYAVIVPGQKCISKTCEQLLLVEALCLCGGDKVDYDFTDVYKRQDKHPKSSRYGRQNPFSQQWNSDEQLCIWRANWADAVKKMGICYTDRQFAPAGEAHFAPAPGAVSVVR